MCADDTHGTPIEVKARQKGIRPEELVGIYHEEHQKDFSDFHINFDCFYSTNSPENRHHSELIFSRLRDRGHVAKRPVAQYYCEKDQRFLPDRLSRGPAPIAGRRTSTATSAKPAERRIPRPTSLTRTAHCAGPRPSSGNRCITSSRCALTSHFCGSGWQPPVGCSRKSGKFIENWFHEGLRDWDISRDGPYFGFKIPGEENKYFYVWLDAPIGYIATTQKFCETSGRDFASYWLDSKAQIYHVIGKDIVYFHTLFWPAMLQGAEYSLPTKVLVHGFLTVNGEKMSKSRGTFINARDYLNHLDPQYLRYYYGAKLSAQPDDLDLNVDDFATRVNAELINKIANLVSRVVPFVNKNFSARLRRLPAGCDSLVAEMLNRVPAVRQNYEAMEFSRAVQDIVAISDVANKYFQDSVPWELVKTDSGAAQDVCTLALNSCRTRHGLDQADPAAFCGRRRADPAHPGASF